MSLKNRKNRKNKTIKYKTIKNKINKSNSGYSSKNDIIKRTKEKTVSPQLFLTSSFSKIGFSGYKELLSMRLIRCSSLHVFHLTHHGGHCARVTHHFHHFFHFIKLFHQFIHLYNIRATSLSDSCFS